MIDKCDHTKQKKSQKVKCLLTGTVIFFVYQPPHSLVVLFQCKVDYKTSNTTYPFCLQCLAGLCNLLVKLLLEGLKNQNH